MKSNHGFTLIELMVTIAILAVIIGIAIPSFSNILLNNRIESAAQDLYGGLQLARSEAVKRKEGVSVCRANSAATGCQNGTDWSASWLIITADNEVLKLWEGGGGLSVTGPSQGLTFYASGMADAERDFQVTGSGCKNDQKRALKVIRLGTTSLRKTAC